MEKLCSIKGSKLYFNGEELLKIESIEKIEVQLTANSVHP